MSLLQMGDPQSATMQLVQISCDYCDAVEQARAETIDYAIEVFKKHGWTIEPGKHSCTMCKPVLRNLPKKDHECSVHWKDGSLIFKCRCGFSWEMSPEKNMQISEGDTQAHHHFRIDSSYNAMQWEMGTIRNVNFIRSEEE